MGLPIMYGPTPLIFRYIFHCTDTSIFSMPSQRVPICRRPVIMAASVATMSQPQRPPSAPSQRQQWPPQRQPFDHPPISSATCSASGAWNPITSKSWPNSRPNKRKSNHSRTNLLLYYTTLYTPHYCLIITHRFHSKNAPLPSRNSDEDTSKKTHAHRTKMCCKVIFLRNRFSFLITKCNLFVSCLSYLYCYNL